MTAKHLTVTRRLPEQVEARIRRDYLPCFNPDDRLYTPGELIEVANGADALLVTPRDLLNATVIARLPGSVRVIATLSVGYEHIDLAAAAARGIQVTNTPGAVTDATADITMLLLLGASRRASEGQALLLRGEWRDPRPTELLGWQLTGKNLGIFGMGRIGRAVAHRARAFGMHIHYTNTKRLHPQLEQDATFHADFRDLLRLSSFLTLHAPATDATRHFLNAETIAFLPLGAIVVNAARGGLIDDVALLAALQTHRIAAAGLDVYEGEPNLRPEYRTLPNVFLLPHLGTATIEARTKMGMCALDNLDAALAGKTPPNLLLP
ncbi:MAG TPA: D-glycerate dehydrogenase [Candidatus Sulfotelmatobacter sp.]|nr:D-glycerate dehydrogenase [Candidatus Sulfotelmatobacter sp.]